MLGSVAPEGVGFRYTFDITNGEALNLWHFIVYTPFGTLGATSTFPERIDPGLSLDVVFSGYDARNIDASLTTLTDAWYFTFGGPDGLAPGGTGTLTFFATTLVSPDLLYAYELSGTYVANGSLEVSGIGRANASAVPEPATWMMLAAGAAFARMARRTRSHR